MGTAYAHCRNGRSRMTKRITAASLGSMPYLPFYKAAARSVGLTAPQLAALEALAWSSDGEVWCRDLGIPQASVRKLETLGLVTIRVKFPSDGNGYVSLTAAGHSACKKGEVASCEVNRNGRRSKSARDDRGQLIPHRCASISTDEEKGETGNGSHYEEVPS